MDFIYTKNGLRYMLCFSLLLVFTSNFFIMTFLIQTDIHSADKNQSRRRENFNVKQSLILKEMQTFPWNTIKKVLQKFNTSQDDSLGFEELQRHLTLLLLKLNSFLVTSPETPVNKSCKTQTTKTELVSTIISSNNCSPLNQPRKVGILLQFGFDVDTLEIHLNELNDYVDKFFIIESIKPHSRFLSGKPLLWNLVKFQERFMKFEAKVVHFVVDDSNLATSSEYSVRNIWVRESLEEELRWEKFLEWNNQTNFFSKHDLLGKVLIPKQNIITFLFTLCLIKI